MSEQEREMRIAGRMGRCIHFTGVREDVCRAGVRYDAAAVNHEPITYPDQRRPRIQHTATVSLPCLDSHNHAKATCDKRECVSRERAEAEVEESEASLRHTMAAFTLIANAPKGATSVPCPRCGGTLHFARASTNGHVHARCATADCLAFMQ